ncbi:MAG: EamA family transporter [Thermoleophilia bacterium]|nr:EamA family transporter [Thermoleophilia bacterium]
MGSQRAAVAGLALLALIWGYNWVPLKLGIPCIGALPFAALRAFLGAAVLFCLVWLTGRPLRLPPGSLTSLALLGLLQTTGFLGLTMWALVSGGAGRTAILSNTMPFWLLLLAWPLLGERPRGSEWVPVVLGLAGLILIIAPWHLHGVTSSLLALGGAISWAGSSVVAKTLHRRKNVDVLSLTAWQMLLGAAPLVVAGAVLVPDSVQWSGTLVWTLAYAVVMATALGWLLWLLVLEKLPAGVAGIGNLGTPVVGVLASWLQLGERPTLSEAVGMVLVLSALGTLLLGGMTSKSSASKSRLTGKADVGQVGSVEKVVRP